MNRFINIKVLAIIVSYLLIATPVYALSTSLFFNVPVVQIEEGQRVTVDVKVASPDKSINAISGSISFSDSLVGVVSISKDRSIVNLWTAEPKVQRNKILFEGIILNPGFEGSSGLLFRVTFEARRAGTVMLNFNEGAVLANDGRGSNILATFNSASFKIIPALNFFQDKNIAEEYVLPGQGSTRLVALPVITDYSRSVESTSAAYLKGRGEPNALTKLVFKDVSLKSIGERFMGFLQTKKKKLDEVLVKNDPSGAFEYTSANNLVAGVYNATPFLVDQNTNTEKPGLGVQLLVSDSRVVKMLVVLINVLGLLIPIVGLVVIIYFIPWYSWKRMRVLKKKLSLEEEKVELTEHQLARQDELQDKLLNNSGKKFKNETSQING